MLLLPPPASLLCSPHQNLKDAIMVTTAGAETLPWLASCVVLPASLGFFMLYGKMVEALPSVRWRWCWCSGLVLCPGALP